MLSLSGKDFAEIFLPITSIYLEWLIQNSDVIQFAIENFAGKISVNYPKHKLLNSTLKLIHKPLKSHTPLDAITIFTDGSGKSGKSVIAWQNPETKKWESDIEEVHGSSQIVELSAVVRVFSKFTFPFNLVTDSFYVAGVVERAEGSLLKEVSNDQLYCLLKKLIFLLSVRQEPYFIMHIRSHSALPGFLAEGNAIADLLAMPVQNTLPNVIEQARISHAFYHQNAPALVRMFNISQNQAKAIVQSCPDCQKLAIPATATGVNPRGLNSLQIWQTDVTQYQSFGRFKHIHVSIDTFSGAIFASAHQGEKSRDVIKHFLQAFAFLGVPQEVKTDNGPAYVSNKLQEFFKAWGIKHITGIPHSSTGQSIVERAHRSLKMILERQKGGTEVLSTIERLNKAIYVFNFLNNSFMEQVPPIFRDSSNTSQAKLEEKPPVFIKDPETGQISGPHQLVTWGRGFACISTDAGLRWVPAKNVKPQVQPIQKQQKMPEEEEENTTN